MMKCKIAHNEGVILAFLLIFISIVDCSYFSSDFHSIQALCSSNRYLYTIKPEEPQQFRLTYNTTVSEIDKWYRKSKRRCRKEFKTINGASHFVVVVSNMSIPSCSEKCQCNYFEIAEPGNTVTFCGEHKEFIYFESKSDYLSIDFQHGMSMPFEVTLSFTVERNTYIITDSPKKDLYHSGHFIESPYFPNTYPADYTSDYIFHSDDKNGRVVLLFLDFQIASSSYIEVVGHNGTIPKRIYGDIFRPPVFVSEDNDLSLRFEANRQPGSSGFRAVSYFLKSSDIPTAVPFTDCGGSKLGFGGLITVESKESKLFDCLWHIITPIFPYGQAYFLTISNISLANVGANASLEFREGRNSKSTIVKSIDCATTDCSSIPYEVTVSATSGLYVRFIGNLNSVSFVQMVYSTYHHGNCSLERSDCQGRCLHPVLICDGLVNCPDGSDELECTRAAETTILPDKKESSSSKSKISFTVIFSFGIVGLLCIVLALFFIYRGVKAVPPATEYRQPETINELSRHLPRGASVGSVRDHLPSYEDFIHASERYPPLLYTRASKRYSESYVPQRTLQHTTSFCQVPVRYSKSTENRSSFASLEAMFTEQRPATPEPSCSYGRGDHDWIFHKFELKNPVCSLKRAWLSDSKLDELVSSDCHLHLSITHCTSPMERCDCPEKPKQYYSLPVNFKIKSCNTNDINIYLPKDVDTRIHSGQNRHFSFCGSKASHSKILSIKTRCHSDPCQFSVHYSLFH